MIWKATKTDEYQQDYEIPWIEPQTYWLQLTTIDDNNRDDNYMNSFVIVLV